MKHFQLQSEVDVTSWNHFLGYLIKHLVQWQWLLAIFLSFSTFPFRFRDQSGGEGGIWGLQATSNQGSFTSADQLHGLRTTNTNDFSRKERFWKSASSFIPLSSLLKSTYCIKYILRSGTLLINPQLSCWLLSLHLFLLSLPCVVDVTWPFPSLVVMWAQ